MNDRELIILAGGKGTRLASIAKGIPKILVPIRERPLLHYLIPYYLSQGVTRFIFSLGHASDPVIRELETHFTHLNISILTEDHPLGTGGALKAALAKAITPHVFAANGDSFFHSDLDDLYRFHLSREAECTLALTETSDTDRYGRVALDGYGRLTAFDEKTSRGPGLVNGGIYLLDREAFLAHPLPAVFSMEKDYLQEYYQRGRILGLAQPGFFIDIGVPEDLFRAQKIMPTYEAGLDG